MKIEMIVLGFVLMLLCAGLVALFMIAFYRKQFKQALLFKGLSSLCFVIFAFAVFLTYEFSWIRLILLVGLCFGIVGDEVLALCQIYPSHDNQHFIGGGVFFIIGHIAYIASMLLMGGPNWIALAIVFAVLVLLSILYESRRKYLSVEIKNSLKLYISIVILFASVGIATFLKQGAIGTALLALGGILFVVSDNILFAFKCGARPRYLQNVVLHVAYYLAQFLIAWSIALI